MHSYRANLYVLSKRLKQSALMVGSRMNTCCVHVERHTSVNQMTGDGAVGNQRQADNRLTGTTVLGQLNYY